MKHVKTWMKEVSLELVLKFEQVIFLLVRLHQRVKQNLLLKKDLKELFSVKGKKRTHHLKKFHMVTSGIVVDAKGVLREKNGDELAPGVNESVRIYIAQKRFLLVIRWRTSW